MFLSAGQDTLARSLRANDRCEGFNVATEGAGVERHPHPTGLGHPTGVSHQPVTNSIMALAPAAAATGPCSYGGRGRRCIATRLGGALGATGLEQLQPRPGAAKTARHRDHVAEPGAAATHRSPTAQVTQRGDRHRQGAGGGATTSHRPRQPYRRPQQPRLGPR